METTPQLAKKVGGRTYFLPWDLDISTKTFIMPLLRRSGSAKSTLSMMQRRATKYQRFLNLSNVFLLTTSTILLFSAAVLIKFYHITKLDFWSVYFVVVPVLMILLGIFTFLTCVFGFLISGKTMTAALEVLFFFLTY